MITAKQFELLRKGNISFNSEKSDKRIPEAFKNADTKQKIEITRLSGLSKYGFYKASASPKSVLALACVLNISPYYLSGESDDRACSDDMILKFYKNCVTIAKKKLSVKKTSAGKEKPVKTVKAESKTVAEKTPEKPVKIKAEKKKADIEKSAESYNVDDESLVSLLRALSIRARFGGEAEKTYNEVVKLLIK